MPTDWEDRYRTGETPWDKGAPSPGLLEFLEREPMRGRVLVPGCGMGHDVRALAKTGADVTGIDLSPSAIAGARGLAPEANAHYEQADLFALPAHLNGVFDWVWEHTCFCAIDPAMRGRYVDAVRGALRDNGLLLAIFYLDPGQALPADGPPFETTLLEIDRLFSPRFQLLGEWPPKRTYEGRRNREWMRLYGAQSGDC